MKISVSQLIFVVLGFFSACFILEIILQFVDRSDYNRFLNDPKSGLSTYKPGSSFSEVGSCFENTVKINNLGFHGPNVEIQKPAGTYRIVVIGGSFVESLQIPVEKNFSYLLEERLNKNTKGQKYEVIPIAFSGNRNFLNVLYYYRFASGLKPDMVINFLTDYDFTEAPAPNRNEEGQIVFKLPEIRQNSTVAEIKNFLRNSKLFMNIYNRFTLITTDHKEKTDKAGDPVEMVTDWKTENEIIGHFSDRAKEDGARFVLASWTGKKLDREFASKISNDLSELASQKKFSYLDMVDGMQREEDRVGKMPILGCDYHWSEDGHRYATQVLYNYLTSSRLAF